ERRRADIREHNSARIPSPEPTRPNGLNGVLVPIKLTVNGRNQDLDVDPDMPLLWAIRDHLKLTGTKFGCGMALCGACTVHIDGQPTRSCVTPVAAAQNRQVTTIEGLATPAGRALQEAWISGNVPQCGYCQSGQIMSAAALLTAKPRPSDEDIDSAMAGNICRCATYVRIRSAIHQAAEALSSATTAQTRRGRRAACPFSEAESRGRPPHLATGSRAGSF